MDDLPVREEGELIDPQSVIALPVAVDLPIFPRIERGSEDPFLQQVEASGRKWVVITDEEEGPRLVLDADALMRDVLFGSGPLNPYRFSHRPVVLLDGATPLGDAIRHLHVEPVRSEDDVIDKDLILVWGEERRIITGADILGRLLRGIVRQEPPIPGASRGFGPHLRR